MKIADPSFLASLALQRADYRRALPQQLAIELLQRSLYGDTANGDIEPPA